MSPRPTSLPIPLAIVLVFLVLASLTGCQLVGIPSYRFDSTMGPECFDHSLDPAPSGSAYETADCASDCPPGFLPPLPHCLLAWQEKRDKPEAPAYPRFHPLPTRPMFAPPAVPSLGSPLGIEAVRYGFPSEEFHSPGLVPP